MFEILVHAEIITARANRVWFFLSNDQVVLVGFCESKGETIVSEKRKVDELLTLFI